MVWCSTLVLFVLLTWLQEAIRQGKLSTGHWAAAEMGKFTMLDVSGGCIWMYLDVKIQLCIQRYLPKNQGWIWV